MSKVNTALWILTLLGVGYVAYRLYKFFDETFAFSHPEPDSSNIYEEYKKLQAGRQEET